MLAFDVMLVTDGGDDVVERTKRALVGVDGTRVAVQLRDKRLEAEVAPIAHALRAVTGDAGALLFINTHVALAAACGADGVQLPEGSMPVTAARASLPKGTVVMVSRHDAAGLTQGAIEGADAAVLSPLFAVPGKGAPLGLDAFAKLARGVSIDVVALGGIDASNAAAAIHAGATAVAVIRSVYAAHDPAAELRALLRAVGEASRVKAAP